MLDLLASQLIRFLLFYHPPTLPATLSPSHIPTRTLHQKRLLVPTKVARMMHNFNAESLQVLNHRILPKSWLLLLLLLLLLASRHLRFHPTNHVLRAFLL